LALGLVCVACSGSDTDDPEGVTGTTKEVRITSGHDCMMMMGKGPDASFYFPYDGRGPGSLGRMALDCGSLRLDAKNREDCRALEADLQPGEAIVFFDADDTEASKFYLYDELVDVYINILPTDMIGTVDFCTGALEYSFDAMFEQVVFGKSQGALSIVSVLTTETVSGDYWSMTGRRLDEKDDLQLVSVAVTPPTGDPLTDLLLDLPTDAVSVNETHVDFPQGRFPCPGDPPPGVADEVHMIVGKEGRLSISSLPPFAYDGKGSDGVGRLGPVVDGRATVEFSQVQIPPLQMIPGWNALRVEIEPHSLSGEIDFCTGQIELDFDATFNSFMRYREVVSLSVKTTITTETSTGFSHTVTGERLDRWGDARLVGVAKVPRTDDAVTNLLLDLANDAVCELPVHLHFHGGERPTCP
jgi:hypothetical protein